MCAWLFASGKLPVKVVSAANHPSNNNSPRLFVTDRLSGQTFLIDTGSDVSVLPKSFLNRKIVHIEYLLHAANSTSIRTYGTRELQLDFSLPKSYSWNFIIAEVQTPIIGADMMKAYHLIPDLTLGKLIDANSLSSVSCILQPTSQPSKRSSDYFNAKS